MPDETTELLRQLKEEMLAMALKDRPGVLILDIPLDQPPPEHEPEYKELTIALDVLYPPPEEPEHNEFYLNVQFGKLLGLMFKELNKRQILTGDCRPAWAEPIETTARFMLDCQRYPVLLSVTPIGPGYIRMMMTISVDPEVL
jgi:hypothetical protein